MLLAYTEVFFGVATQTPCALKRMCAISRAAEADWMQVDSLAKSIDLETLA